MLAVFILNAIKPLILNDLIPVVTQEIAFERPIGQTGAKIHGRGHGRMGPHGFCNLFLI